MYSNLHFIYFWFLPYANEVCEGYVFTGVCLSTGGSRSLSRGGLHPVGGGESLHLGGSLSRGVCVQRGVSARGGGPCPGGSQGDPPNRDPPPYSNERVVHILLKYILVLLLFTRSYDHRNKASYYLFHIFIIWKLVIIKCTLIIIIIMWSLHESSVNFTYV